MALIVSGSAYASFGPSRGVHRPPVSAAQADTARQSSVRADYASLFAPAGGPSSTALTSDYQPVNLGVAFRSGEDGSLVGLRMFRASGETAAHPATLWSSSYVRIGQLTFPASSTPGWQVAMFAQPVAITADEVYVVSYFTETGYASTPRFFSATPHTRGTLSTLPDDETTHNGLYTYASQTAAPTSTWYGSNYWIDVLETDTASSPSDQPSSPATSSTPTSSAPSSPTSSAPTTSSAPSTPVTTAPPTSPTASSSPSAPADGTKYVLPGQVGFLGDRSALRVVPDDGVPAGCTWDSAHQYLECQDNAVISNSYVKGGVDAYADITITNSVVAANPANWLLVNLRSAGGHCTVTHSTLAYANGGHLPDGFTTWGVGGINDMHGCNGVFTDNDISGTPDGIDTGADNTVIKNNYVHDLATIGTYPNNTHNDGIQLYGCSNCVITGNYFDIGWDGTHQNSCFFASDGDVGHGILFSGNYLSGGGYAFRNIIGLSMTVTDNTFQELPDQYGLTLTGASASFAAWTGNVTTTGQSVAVPRP